jgi:hypothetical protein
VNDLGKWNESVHVPTFLDTMEKDGEQLRQFLKFVRFLGPALRRADKDTNATVDTGAETTTESEDTAEPHRGKRGRELEPESSNSKRSKPSQHLQENTSKNAQEPGDTNASTDVDSDASSISTTDWTRKPGERVHYDDSSEDGSVQDPHVSDLAPSASKPPVADYIPPHSPQPPAVSPQRHEVSGQSAETSSAAPQPPSAMPSASRNPPDVDKSPHQSPRPQDVSHDASGRSVETSSAASQPSSHEAEMARLLRALYTSMNRYRR